MTDRALTAPDGCCWCGIAEREHMQRWHRDAGWHQWEPPTEEQIKTRMLARRNAR